jgi:hypothetical protein
VTKKTVYKWLEDGTLTGQPPVHVDVESLVEVASILAGVNGGVRELVRGRT